MPTVKREQQPGRRDTASWELVPTAPTTSPRRNRDGCRCRLLPDTNRSRHPGDSGTQERKSNRSSLSRVLRHDLDPRQGRELANSLLTATSQSPAGEAPGQPRWLPSAGSRRTRPPRHGEGRLETELPATRAMPAWSHWRGHSRPPGNGPVQGVVARCLNKAHAIQCVTAHSDSSVHCLTEPSLPQNVWHSFMFLVDVTQLSLTHMQQVLVLPPPINLQAAIPELAIAGVATAADTMKGVAAAAP
jgi:hypothetical protein